MIMMINKNAKQFILLLILILTGNSIWAQEKSAIISFEKKKHDFGVINNTKDTAVHAIFIFNNRGTSPLVIHKVTTSCGCTVAEWTKVPVKQGDKGFIKIIFNPKGYSGKFSKNVFVSSNAIKDIEILKIEGEVTNKKQKSFFDLFSNK
jgi:hypothetical protein